MEREAGRQCLQSQLPALKLDVHRTAQSDLGDVSTSASDGDGCSPSAFDGADLAGNERYYTAASSTGMMESDAQSAMAFEDACGGAGDGLAVEDPRDTDLDEFCTVARFSGEISAGHFAKVKTLSDCCEDGKVELHRWHHEDGDRCVVVKRVRASRVNMNMGKERNERVVHRHRSGRNAEDTLAEIGVYCRLFSCEDVPRYLLKMHVAFHSAADAWLVLEHADGGDLFTRLQAARPGAVGLGQVRRWMYQLFAAAAYLHRSGIGHRDISMENVLLCKGEVRLMDFGQAVVSHSRRGTPLRYFLAVGKPYYRPAECRIPAEAKLRFLVPVGSSPGQVVLVDTLCKSLCEVKLPDDARPEALCQAEPWGYAVQPVDVFACGVCFFIAATGTPPWREAIPSDTRFAWVRAHGLAKLLASWKKALPPDATELLTRMVAVDPALRPTMDECVQDAWFESLRGEPLPTHAASEWCRQDDQPGAGSPEVGFTGDMGDFCRPD